MRVANVCEKHVDLAESSENVAEIARRMHRRGVGTLVVTNQRKVPEGIITDRDLVSRVIASGRRPEETLAGEVMTALPRTVSDDAPISTALALMKAHQVRRLVVVDSRGQLAGIVSLDDVLRFYASEFASVRKLLERDQPETAAKA